MNDKKKLIVLLALAAVVLAVGVFQLKGGSNEPVKPSNVVKKTQSEPPKEAEPTEPGDVVPGSTASFAATPLPARDPFDPGRLTHATPSNIKPSPQPVVRPMPAPPTMSGSFSAAPLPVSGGSNIVLEPGQKLPSADDFNYTLAGVITGANPAAVFASATGNQMLVVLGGSIEPNSKLVSVGDGKAVVRHHGKTLTLSVGEGPK